jgi:hypothetical protein
MSLSVLQSVHSARAYLEGLCSPQGQFAVVTAAETWFRLWHSSGRCTLQDPVGPSGAQMKVEMKGFISLFVLFAFAIIDCWLTNQ